MTVRIIVSHMILIIDFLIIVCVLKAYWLWKDATLIKNAQLFMPFDGRYLLITYKESGALSTQDNEKLYLILHQV